MEMLIYLFFSLRIKDNIEKNEAVNSCWSQKFEDLGYFIIKRDTV